MVFVLTSEQGIVSIRVDKPAYFPGEIIRGVIYIKIKSNDVNAGILYLKLCGQEKINQLNNYGQFLSLKQFTYRKQKKISDFGKKMPIISCKKYFELEVPNVTPSFTINYYKQVQCRVLYFLCVFFQSQDKNITYKPQLKHRVSIHILQKQNMTRQILQEYSGESKSQKRCCFTSGQTKISVHLNQNSYIFGENMTIQLKIDNQQQNQSITGIQFNISAKLTILYNEKKTYVNNFFELFSQNIITNIPKKIQTQLDYTIKLPQDKQTDLPTAIFPQSSLKSQTIVFQHALTVKAFFQETLFFHQSPVIITVPVTLLQHQKREQSQIIQSVNNLSQIQSMSQFDNPKISQSLLRKFIYGDHNCQGYGKQDGYIGPERKYNPEESLNNINFLQENKGTLEQLMFKNQYKEENEDIYDEIENEVEGNSISINNEQKSLTIFSPKPKSQYDFQNLSSHDADEEGNILHLNQQEQLQTIKEEQDSKGTQININLQLANSGKRVHTSIYNTVQPLSTNPVKVEILDSIHQSQNNQLETEEQKQQTKKEFKTMKVLFGETSTDTLDAKEKIKTVN